MRKSRTSIVLTVFALAAVASYATARQAASLIEAQSEIDIRTALDGSGLTWAEVEADGLQVIMAGQAPTEALRFEALSVAGSVVDPERLIDEIEVTPTEALAPPRFSAEILRNTSGVSVIGLIPEKTDRAALMGRLSSVEELPVTDLLETADHPVPPGWEDALAFAMNAIILLPRAKASVDAGRVEITAIADSPEEKTEMEALLLRQAPPALRLEMNITAPRPVISPFTLRFVMDAEGARFDACTADTEEAEARIRAAAIAAGLSGTARCTVAMGVPTPQWAEGAEQAIASLARLGAGTVTFSDADVTLAAVEGTDPALFDEVVGELETGLPEVFVLNAVLPVPVETDSDPAEFIATLSPEGMVQLRGRLADETMREVADSFAKAKFGSDAVHTAARVVPDLPADWSARVLSGIEALSLLDSGVVAVTEQSVALSGRSGDREAGEAAARLLVAKLGEDSAFEVDVAYVEALDPVAILPTPEECEQRLGTIVATKKINFEPGSATIDESALGILDQIADALQDCGTLRLEVQGHTDSQGREEMNLALSQARAESVLNELRARRVLTSSYIAKGYGEARPIADNGTEEGRETNRRIEFRLVSSEPSVPQGDSALESLAETGDNPAQAE
jgi:OOP family OmpA-OmpF porin